MFMDEGSALMPALPTAKSAYIVLGEVKTAEAHVSENKENVYSEFTVSVTKVFKTASSSVVEGSEITVDRVGGFVKYPNGRTLLYSVSGRNMPAVGGRYILLLSSLNNEDLLLLSLLTALVQMELDPWMIHHSLKSFEGGQKTCS
jgi:hypothetical protein